MISARNQEISAAALIYGLLGFMPSEKDILEGIDIDKEADLIRRKKSKLPARMRSVVLRRVEMKGKSQC